MNVLTRVIGRGNPFVVLGTLAALCLLLLNAAWVGEDSYIGWRVSDNIIRGHGPVWNVGERIQVFSNTLFFYLITAVYTITGNIFLVCVGVSLLLTVGYIYVLFKQAKFETYTLLALTFAIACCKGFVDYAICGLENPLSYLLVGWFFVEALKERADTPIPKLLAIASLVYLNRQDNILLCAPFLAFEGIPYLVDRYKHRVLWRSLMLCVVAVLPAVISVIFSIYYYGVPFPITYYYKVKAGLSSSDLLDQGFAYFGYIVRFEPQTLVAIALCIILPLGFGRRAERLLALGLCVFLLYVLKIGADYMAGRFLSVPFAGGLILVAERLTHYKPAQVKIVLGVFVALFLLSITTPSPPIKASSDFYCIMAPYRGPLTDDTPICVDVATGIADERAFYYPVSGFVPALHRREFKIAGFFYIWDAKRQFKNGDKMVIANTAGYGPYELKDSVYVFDPYGLANFYLPWMPHLDYGTPFHNWRPGHIWRRQPVGLIKTLISGQNHIANPYGARLYDQLQLVMRSSLAAPGRMDAIWKLNTTKLRYDSLRFPVERLTSVDPLAQPGARVPKDSMAYQHVLVYPLNAGCYKVSVLSDSLAKAQIRLYDYKGNRLTLRQEQDKASFDITLDEAHSGPFALLYSSTSLQYPGLSEALYQVDTCCKR